MGGGGGGGAEYSRYRVDMKSNSNTRRGDNPKNKKAYFFIYTLNMCLLFLFSNCMYQSKQSEA